MAYIANPVNFDGTNDNCNLAATVTGIADGAIILFSTWFRILGGAGVNRRLFTLSSGNNPRLSVHCGSNDNLAITGRNSANTTILNGEITTGSPADTDWHHLFIYLNMASASERAILLDGADAAPTWHTYDTAEVLDLSITATPTCKVGAATSGGVDAFRWNGDMADFYFTTPASWSDPISSGLISDFRLSGAPVDLGSDGSVPLGTAPLVYMSGATVDWHTNKGTGGGFTEVGALTDGAVPLPVTPGSLILPSLSRSMMSLLAR